MYKKLAKAIGAPDKRRDEMKQWAAQIDKIEDETLELSGFFKGLAPNHPAAQEAWEKSNALQDLIKRGRATLNNWSLIHRNTELETRLEKDVPEAQKTLSELKTARDQMAKDFVKMSSQQDWQSLSERSARVLTLYNDLTPALPALASYQAQSAQLRQDIAKSQAASQSDADKLSQLAQFKTKLQDLEQKAHVFLQEDAEGSTHTAERKYPQA